MSMENITIEKLEARRKSRTSSQSSSDEIKHKSSKKDSDKIESQDDIKNMKKQTPPKENANLHENNDNFSEDEDENKQFTSSKKTVSYTKVVSYIITDKPESISTNTSSKTHSSKWKYLIIFGILAIIIKFLLSNEDSNISSNDINWRLKVDPNNTLSKNQQHTVRASLKPILDKSSTKVENEEDSVSTLLILSSNEEYAAKLARCILRLVNTNMYKEKISTEIDLQSHRGGKLQLDLNLKFLLSAGGDIRAVLLRHIDDNLSDDAFERLRLLFAYCDGENPVIPHRLIIMTATSNSVDESELREKFKIRWPKEHDFVDALMSRISGHTLYIDNDRRSIC
ncbi:unnamed protein product [Rotaria sp. Silwood2]|nr:unnamed protein product [Rotaria sp. Silwood2]CAF2847694.1 unnamed protein product [Rotaria sp. Silwood2]CAF3979950.1 unnamed protein product [Rotaria sp. Silwood2]CAF4006195.1 unnamed protein product [Rotaria sp. Silwood2]